METNEEVTLEAVFAQHQCLCMDPNMRLPGVRVLGLKGAALAAFGERPRVFGGVWLPFTASDEGVKLGEAMLKRFLMLYKRLVSSLTSKDIVNRHLSTGPFGCALTRS